MISTNPYADMQTSLLAFCLQLKTQLQAKAPTLQNIKWDAYSNAQDFPETDLLGPFQVEMTDEGELIYGSVTILLSTLDDLNVDRLDELAGLVYAKVRPNKYIPFIATGTGAALGVLKIQEGTSVMPMDYSSGRPMKGISFDFAVSEIGS